MPWSLCRYVMFVFWAESHRVTTMTANTGSILLEHWWNPWWTSPLPRLAPCCYTVSPISQYWWKLWFLTTVSRRFHRLLFTPFFFLTRTYHAQCNNFWHPSAAPHLAITATKSGGLSGLLSKVICDKFSLIVRRKFCAIYVFLYERFVDSATFCYFFQLEFCVNEPADQGTRRPHGYFVRLPRLSLSYDRIYYF